MTVFLYCFVVVSFLELIYRVKEFNTTTLVDRVVLGKNKIKNKNKSVRGQDVIFMTESVC